jgi:hypothetical protein
MMCGTAEINELELPDAGKFYQEPDVVSVGRVVVERDTGTLQLG